MRASWGFRVIPRMRPIDAITGGGNKPGGKSCLLKWHCEGRGNVSTWESLFPRLGSFDRRYLAWGTCIWGKEKSDRSDSLSQQRLSPLPSTSTPLAPLLCSFLKWPLHLIALNPITWSSCPSLWSSPTNPCWSASPSLLFVSNHHSRRRSHHSYNPVSSSPSQHLHRYLISSLLPL